MAGLNNERSIWIEQEDLGKDIVIKHKSKHYEVKIPPKINKKVILRLRGLGKTKDNNTGDLLLHVWLNKGDDIRKELWLSETAARTGASKKLLLEEKKIQILIPPESHNGLVIRIKGLGKKPSFSWSTPFLHRKRGNLLVKLLVYPDSITPKYRTVETLTADELFMDGQIYRMKDEIIRKMGESSFKVNPIKADAVADLFNEYGWIGISHTLKRHLKLNRVNIKVTKSDSISLPGGCQRSVTMQNNIPVASNYNITIKEQFLDNPFSVAAILAHELCHVIYSERIDSRPKGFEYNMKGIKQEPLEEERMVDLLVFMFKIGEFQLRVSRDKRITLGYFNQDVFDRIQVIFSKK